MVEEVATIILELHQGGGGHANTACCQHQAEATTSDREKDEEQGKENKKRGEGSRCKDLTILYILCLASFSVSLNLPALSLSTLSPFVPIEYIKLRSQMFNLIFVKIK